MDAAWTPDRVNMGFPNKVESILVDGRPWDRSRAVKPDLSESTAAAQSRNEPSESCAFKRPRADLPPIDTIKATTISVKLIRKVCAAED